MEITQTHAGQTGGFQIGLQQSTTDNTANQLEVYSSDTPAFFCLSQFLGFFDTGAFIQQGSRHSCRGEVHSQWSEGRWMRLNTAGGVLLHTPEKKCQIILATYCIILQWVKVNWSSISRKHRPSYHVLFHPYQRLHLDLLVVIDHLAVVSVFFLKPFSYWWISSLIQWQCDSQATQY